MVTSQIEQYKKQAVESMTASERVVLLYDTALKNLRGGLIMLDAGDTVNFTTCMEKSRNIFFHLETVLDPAYPIAEDLAACYAFFRRQINETMKTRDKSHVEIIIPQVESLRNGWEEAGKRIAKGQG